MGAVTLSNEALLERLVSFDTTSDHPSRPLSDFIADYLAGQGCDVHSLPYDDGRKVNLVARVGPEVDGGLILSGHLDVVPATEPDWTSEPFKLIDGGDRYVGRGTADMKGFVALAVNELARMAGEKLKHPLVLILTSDEEVGTLGAAELVKSWDNRFSLPGEALVGEPTGLRVIRMHKGHLRLQITIIGTPAHTGCPELGVSAIEPAADILAALRTLRERLETERTETSDYFPHTPFPVLCVSTIEGGRALNIIPDRCTIGVGVRLLPGQTTEVFVERFSEALSGVPNLPRGRVAWEVLSDTPPMLSPADTPLHTELTAMMEQADSLGVSYATDAGQLQRLGIRIVIWGPGRIEHAHRANEYVLKDEFARAAEALERIVRQRCWT